MCLSLRTRVGLLLGAAALAAACAVARLAPAPRPQPDQETPPPAPAAPLEPVVKPAPVRVERKSARRGRRARRGPGRNR